MNPPPPPRRVATPTPLSVKRKETDHFKPSPVFTKSLKRPPPRNGSASAHAAKSTFHIPHSGSAKPTRPAHCSAPASKPASSPHAAKPECSNLLLAGYMAHEFLTTGTILGAKVDPAQAAAIPLGPINKQSRSTELSRQAVERYAEVASLLKTDRAHIPGIVNPTQLASYLTRSK
ncbi:unnamed protein product [Rhodiola kirilowii]